MVVAAEAFFQRQRLSMETPPQPERRFIQRGLPWVIASGGLVTYLATLNHWLTLSSLAVVVEVNGWGWQSMVFQPALFLLTWPLRWLSGSGVPLALNLFTAVCASLTLALLARSVALLPHNRLEQQRRLAQNEQALLALPSAWVPVVLAAVALGLQLTFWENATAASGEMLDLLLFACPIWCLLEYRRERRRCWLDRTALLCGIAAANSWGMVGFLPLFGLALLRSKRLQFFNRRFLRRAGLSAWRKAAAPALRADLRFFLRMVLFGLAGLLLLLLLPLVQAFSPNSPVGFWQALGTVAGSYRGTLFFLAGTVFTHHRDVALVLAAVSLLPLLILSIRWRTFTGRERYGGLDPVALAIYVAHAFLLLLCLWVAFDPPFSPLHISRRLGLSFPFLPLYYLGALCIGYYSGFLLLIFSGDPGRGQIVQRVLRWTAPKLVYTFLGLTLLGLLVKNLPAIRVTNGPQLDQYARLAVSVLPPEGAVLLSDDPTRLALLRAALVREGKSGRYMPVDVNTLPLAPYRAWLRRNYPKSWPEPNVEAKPPNPEHLASRTNAPLDGAGLFRLMSLLVQSNRVYYLHPGFGYLLEHFYLQPRGLLYELTPYPTNTLGGPLLTGAELAENEDSWKRAIETGVNPLTRLITQTERPRPGMEGRLMEWLHLKTSSPSSIKSLARWYSGALNCWGVTLQRNDQWSEAARCFALASELNPDNLPARVNLECNRKLQAGQKLTLLAPKSNEEQFGKYPNWNQILISNGPFDEPAFCYQVSLAYAQRNLRRQASQQLERAAVLAPRDINARLVWGDLWNRCRMPDRALQVAAEIQADPSLQPLDPKLKVELAFLEAEAWFLKTNQAKAKGVLLSLLDSHPGDTVLLDRTRAVFTAHGSYSNALRIADQQLHFAPDNVPRLLEAGSLCLLAGEFSNAIPLLTRALSLTNSYGGRINRALAYVHLGRLDAAEADYREALRVLPASYQPYYGLAEVARRKGETNAATRYYRQYLSKAATDSGESKAVAARLKELQPGAP
jgi:tetratricopeptide (TPR) repeat protein